MRNVLFLSIHLVFLANVLLATDVFVGQHEAAELRADDSSVFSGRMIVSDEGEIVKTGQGTLSISSSSIGQSWPATFTVLDGTLALDLNGTASMTRPDIMDVAALWVSATDEESSHFTAGTGENDLYRWYDVRETDVSSPKYIYAQASTKWTTVQPVKTTTNGFASVWFGGLTSGVCMDWYWPAGSRFKEKTVKHVLAVHGVLSSYGPIFCTGSDEGNSVCAFITPVLNAGINSAQPYSLLNGYFWREANIPCVWNGRTWLDGLRSNPLDALDVAKGFHLLEVDASRWQSSLTSGFFSERNKKAFSGGDFLCEAVVFTNVLSEAQRIQVGSYLMKKWLGASSPKLRLVVSDGASASVVAGGDATLDLSGAGSISKTGNGNVVFRSSNPSVAATMGFSGNLDVGTVPVTMSTSWPIAANTGERITVSAAEKGRQVVVSHDAAAGTIVKDGEDELVMQSIPSAAEKLKVEAGRLILRQETRSASPNWTTLFGSVVNGDFEGFDESHFTTTPFTLPTSETNGWWSSNGKNVYVANWDKWTTSFVGGTKANFQFYVPPETGECVLFASSGGIAYGKVTIPEDGWWELSLKRQGRASDSYYGTYADIVLLPASSGNTISADFGRVTFSDPDRRWKKVALSAYVPAGTYRMRLTFAGGGSMLLDDFALRRIAAPTSWPIPGGDFERASIKRCGSGYYAATPKETMDFTSENTMSGWSFTANAESSFNPPSGLVTYAMTNAYGIATSSGYATLYNDSRQPEGGFVEAFFNAEGAEISTTFTPPAGTWLLRVDTAHRHATAGSLNAVVVADGVSTSLGTVSVDKRAMTAATFPNPITFDGSQTVTLCVTGHLGNASSGIWVDDFRLVSLEDRGEMVVNGSFEPNISGWTVSGTSESRRYTDVSAAYGTDIVDGGRFITLRGPATISQDVVFPKAGVYRISFWQHTRIADRGTYGENPVMAWIAANGATNEIGRTDAVSHTNFVQSAFDFRVNEAGTYTLGISGTSPYTRTEAVLDGVSLMPVTVASEPMEIPSGLAVTVVSDAKLRLDFDGVRRVKSVRLGGRRVYGTIDASSYPEYLEGRGAFEAAETGITINFR